jgi:signal transduction histidine kinase
VLTAHAMIPGLRWTVFAEQPLEEALAPIEASIKRSLMLLALGVGLAMVASLFLARRMVRPIQALQVGAARIGGGELGHRIDIRTGDELETLARDFNRMTEQVRESYATLEQRVVERTQALTESLEQQTATAEILRVISGSPTDVQPVLDAVAANAARVCDATDALIRRVDGDRIALVAHFGTLATLEAPPLTRASVAGRAILDCETVQVTDMLDDSVAGEFSEGRLMADRGQYRTVLATPLVREADHVAVGVIVVRRADVHPFTDKQIALLQTFASQSVIAIENVRLFTELQERTSQLQVANRHKDEFLANMSHELRTPLNAIIGFSEVMLERMFGDVNAKQEEYLNDILSSGRHLLSLINDILDLAKIESGKMDLELTDFSLPVAIDNALTLVHERAARRGLTLTQEVDERVADFRGDERKIKQVLLNLLSNAIKFTPEGGTVAVRAHVKGEVVEIAVADTGVGIAPEDQELVFEEFRQVGTDVAKKHEGTGLGLALARRFVELHGGNIWLESEVGVGSTFTFALPVRL